jgi:hypothetical protein
MFSTNCTLVLRVLSLRNFMSPTLQHQLFSTILLIVHMLNNDASTAALVPREETGWSVGWVWDSLQGQWQCGNFKVPVGTIRCFPYEATRTATAQWISPYFTLSYQWPWHRGALLWDRAGCYLQTVHSDKTGLTIYGVKYRTEVRR